MITLSRTGQAAVSTASGSVSVAASIGAGDPRRLIKYLAIVPTCLSVDLSRWVPTRTLLKPPGQPSGFRATPPDHSTELILLTVLLTTDVDNHGSHWTEPRSGDPREQAYLSITD
jgi:hypothetical protein